MGSRAAKDPGGYTTAGTLDNMILCPANGVDTFKKFNGSDGVFDPSNLAVYQDNVQSFSTDGARHRPDRNLVPDVVLEAARDTQNTNKGSTAYYSCLKNQPVTSRLPMH